MSWIEMWNGLVTVTGNRMILILDRMMWLWWRCLSCSSAHELAGAWRLIDQIVQKKKIIIIMRLQARLRWTKSILRIFNKNLSRELSSPTLPVETSYCADCRPYTSLETMKRFIDANFRMSIYKTREKASRDSILVSNGIPVVTIPITERSPKELIFTAPHCTRC